MRVALGVLLCLIVLTLLRPAASAEGLKWVADVPLLDCDATPCVEAELGDGRTARLALDTGNAASIVDTKTAAALGLRPASPPKPGIPPGMYRAVLPSVVLGGAAFPNISVVVLDLAGMIAQGQVPHVAGTLAYTAFKDRVLQLDFVTHRLRISQVLQAPAPCGEPCDSISFIKFGGKGPPIVVAQGFGVNGHPVSAQIDTMFTGSMLVYSPAIQKTGLSGAAKTPQLRTFAFTDGGVQMKQAPINSEMFHNVAFGQSMVYFPTPGVHEPDGFFEATVGLELFHDSVLTLDFHDMKVSLQRHS